MAENRVTRNPVGRQAFGKTPSLKQTPHHKLDCPAVDTSGSVIRYQLVMITAVCIVAAILALGAFPLELRISAVIVLGKLGRVLVASITSQSA